MHKKHSSVGLVIVTVTMDEAKDMETRQGIRGFLDKMQASFVNLLLDEPESIWEAKFRFNSPPCYFVFNRQGKWTQFRGEDGDGVDYKAMDELIVSSLREK